MARLDVNRSGEMEVFAWVFELGGFSAAARELRMTPSAISKLVGRLETRLGARLVNRSTRGLQFTPEGRSFYDRSVRLLADLEEVERSVAKAKVPSMPSILGRVGSCRFGSVSFLSFWPSGSKSATARGPRTRERPEAVGRFNRTDRLRPLLPHVR
jgi:molybdenum-dependent DNA-binding transcriptional regulator ModE